jgi:Flp pilus assembly protein TadG
VVTRQAAPPNAVDRRGFPALAASALFTTDAKTAAPARRLRKFVHDEGGAVLVEFTILVPIFLLLLFGVIEWGNIFYVQSNMATAARMAARAVAVGSVAYSSSASTMTTAAIGVACGSTSPLSGSPYTYTFKLTYNQGCTNGNVSQGFGTVTMNIKTPMAPVSLINYLGTIASTATITAQATMQQEQVCASGATITGTATSQTC